MLSAQVSTRAVGAPKPTTAAGRRANAVVAHARPERPHEAAAPAPWALRAALALSASALLVGPATAAVEPVYFGNGCFWGRQKDFVETEKALGRTREEMSAVVGYAGGKVASPNGKVCYYYANPQTVYEKLGHAEVVQVDIKTDSQTDAEKDMAAFAKTYFGQFRKTRFGMQRLDPQDAGPGYRNVIGLPGGVNSPLFPIIEAANVNKMQLVPGNGNEFVNNREVEGDDFNKVWILDSSTLPFNLAEQYHQFHNGIGKAFPEDYRVDLKKDMMSMGKVKSTGCPEFPF